MSIKERYNSYPAQLYREKLKAIAEVFLSFFLLYPLRICCAKYGVGTGVDASEHPPACGHGAGAEALDARGRELVGQRRHDHSAAAAPQRRRLVGGCRLRAARIQCAQVRSAASGDLLTYL
jgi:hypothetical protein